ncbi:hypothetical protein BN946_scf185014.g21 [Trametes cinnabarina]|uniref:LIM zinc-binding domain-containing protein n=1 Tax=Pycnoporus cinnabarinus TaxID=5643 RepID=A0A060SH68_PYCCI|nr:hypothetical protein BN946_scf185014.g21 [Trametes cinnabarina]
MDGRRANAPRFLDIASATQYGMFASKPPALREAHLSLFDAAAANTPPLSPGSGTPSMSPHSPHSQRSPVSPGVPSPNSVKTSPNITPTAPDGPAIVASPTSPVSVHSLCDRVLPPSQEPPKAPLPDPPSTPRLPFFEKFKNKLPAVDTAKADPASLASASADPSPLSPRSDDSSYDGLAPLPLATPAKPVASGSSSGNQNKVRFPSMTNSESKYSSSSSSTDSPRMPQRTLSSSTAGSSYTSRTVAKSTGALDRAMETLFEDSPLSPTTSTGSRPFAAADAQRESVGLKSPKLPTRSHTSPTLPSSSSVRPDVGKSSSSSSGGGASKRPKTRICVRCERVIDDGRWIQMEGGNVLCDKCWKNMYLPKLPYMPGALPPPQIIRTACDTYPALSFVQKPFPDKTFYVFDGKPYCAYHYHEENNSLCAAARCGQPIEGPCAVSHAGDRYHPEHLVCEYRGCTERLAEYYELDGRMLCERHVQKAIDERDDEDEDEDAFGQAGDRTTVALKRVTRFIDLAALGPVR